MGVLRIIVQERDPPEYTFRLVIGWCSPSLCIKQPMGLGMKAWRSLVYLSVMLQKYSRGLCLSWGQGIAFFQDSDYVSKDFRKFFFI